jgi:hypothetical protein
MYEELDTASFAELFTVKLLSLQSEFVKVTEGGLTVIRELE